MCKRKNRKGVTLVELLVAFTIIVIIFAAIAPQFRAIRKSWSSTEARAEIIQNGRVLAEHITRNLAAARQIVSVSPSGTTTGFIIFKDNNDIQKRYMFSGGYVVFGDLGSEEQLAGPVDRFQISCWDINDFDNLTIDGNNIRFVQIETDFTNTDVLGAGKTFTTSAYLQTNADANGLVGCWKLDETSGSTVADRSGSGHDGTLIGNGWTTGLIGGALEFDGTNDYVTIPDGTYLHIENLSISFWVKTSQTGSSGEWYKNPLIFEKDTPGLGNDGFGTSLYNQKLEFVIGDSVLTSNTSVSDEVWHHVALTKDSSKNIAIYIDGSFDNSKVAIYNFTNTAALHIGKPLQGVYFNGVIDDVRIYSRVLSAAEIAKMANILRCGGVADANAAVN